MYSSGRLVTLCLSEFKFPTSDEFERSEVSQGFVRAHAIGGGVGISRFLIADLEEMRVPSDADALPPEAR